MENIPFTIRKVPERIVVGLSRRTCNADGRSVTDIPACWTEFFKQNAAAKIKNRAIPPAMYVVYSDYASDWKGEYSFLLGCGVTRAESVPEGMEVRRIPAQTYAVFNAKGRMPDELLAVWATVWPSSLPRTYTYDFEVYDKRFTRPLNKEVDVYVAIDPEQLKKLQK
nr:GyrI-like domain-containing protein [uncultured Methanoregula sp.]